MRDEYFHLSISRALDKSTEDCEYRARQLIEAGLISPISEDAANALSAGRLSFRFWFELFFELFVELTRRLLGLKRPPLIIAPLISVNVGGGIRSVGSSMKVGNVRFKLKEAFTTAAGIEFARDLLKILASAVTIAGVANINLEDTEASVIWALWRISMADDGNREKRRTVQDAQLVPRLKTIIERHLEPNEISEADIKLALNQLSLIQCIDEIEPNVAYELVEELHVTHRHRQTP